MKKALSLALLLGVNVTQAAEKADWKGRTIYQLLTDRFAKTNGDTSPCSNLGDYCGGSW